MSVLRLLLPKPESVQDLSSQYSKPQQAINYDRISNKNQQVSVRFTNEQLQKLNDEYARSSRRTVEECKKLAINLGVEELRVRHWFYVRRYEEKKLKNSKTVGTSLMKNESQLTGLSAEQEFRNENFPLTEATGFYGSGSNSQLIKSAYQPYYGCLLESNNENQQNPILNCSNQQDSSGIPEKTPKFQLEHRRSKIPSPYKRVATFFTKEQVEKLTIEFNRTRFPTADRCKKLAHGLGVPEKKITTWFGNRRHKEKLKNSMKNDLQIQQQQLHSSFLESTQREKNSQVTSNNDSSLIDARLESYPETLHNTDLARTSNFENISSENFLKNNGKVGFRFTEQVEILKKEYDRKKCTTNEEQKEIAKFLDVDEMQVRQWFYEKNKKENLRNAPVNEKISCKNIKKKYSKRFKFTEENVKILKKVFSRKEYLSRIELEELVKYLSIDEVKIRSWFSNHRKKEKEKKIKSSLTRNSLMEDQESDQPPQIVSTKNLFNKTSEPLKAPFTKEQVEKLRIEYNKKKYLTDEDCEKLAKNVGIEESKVKSWFENRRNWEKLKETSSVISNSFINKLQPTSLPDQEPSSILVSISDQNSNNLWKQSKKSTSTGKKKKILSRLTLTNTKEKKLEKVFKSTNQPSVQLYEKLSTDLEVPKKRLRKWFKNRRKKQRILNELLGIYNSSSYQQNSKPSENTPERDENFELIYGIDLGDECVPNDIVDETMQREWFTERHKKQKLNHSVFEQDKSLTNEIESAVLEEQNKNFKLIIKPDPDEIEMLDNTESQHAASETDDFLGDQSQSSTQSDHSDTSIQEHLKRIIKPDPDTIDQSGFQNALSENDDSSDQFQTSALEESWKNIQHMIKPDPDELEMLDHTESQHADSETDDFLTDQSQSQSTTQNDHSDESAQHRFKQIIKPDPDTTDQSEFQNTLSENDDSSDQFQTSTTAEEPRKNFQHMIKPDPDELEILFQQSTCFESDGLLIDQFLSNTMKKESDPQESFKQIVKVDPYEPRMLIQRELQSKLPENIDSSVGHYSPGFVEKFLENEDFQIITVSDSEVPNRKDQTQLPQSVSESGDLSANQVQSIPTSKNMTHQNNLGEIKIYDVDELDSSNWGEKSSEIMRNNHQYDGLKNCYHEPSAALLQEQQPTLAPQFQKQNTNLNWSKSQQNQNPPCNGLQQSHYQSQPAATEEKQPFLTSQFQKQNPNFDWSATQLTQVCNDSQNSYYQPHQSAPCQVQQPTMQSKNQNINSSIQRNRQHNELELSSYQLQLENHQKQQPILMSHLQKQAVNLNLEKNRQRPDFQNSYNHHESPCQETLPVLTPQCQTQAIDANLKYDQQRNELLKRPYHQTQLVFPLEQQTISTPQFKKQAVNLNLKKNDQPNGLQHQSYQPQSAANQEQQTMLTTQFQNQTVNLNLKKNYQPNGLQHQNHQPQSAPIQKQQTMLTPQFQKQTVNLNLKKNYQPNGLPHQNHQPQSAPIQKQQTMLTPQFQKQAVNLNLKKNDQPNRLQHQSYQPQSAPNQEQQTMLTPQFQNQTVNLNLKKNYQPNGLQHQNHQPQSSAPIQKQLVHTPQFQNQNPNSDWSRTQFSQNQTFSGLQNTYYQPQQPQPCQEQQSISTLHRKKQDINFNCKENSELYSNRTFQNPDKLQSNFYQEPQLISMQNFEKQVLNSNLVESRLQYQSHQLQPASCMEQQPVLIPHFKKQNVNCSWMENQQRNRLQNSQYQPQLELLQAQHPTTLTPQIQNQAVNSSWTASRVPQNYQSNGLQYNSPNQSQSVIFKSIQNPILTPHFKEQSMNYNLTGGQLLQNQQFFWSQNLQCQPQKQQLYLTQFSQVVNFNFTPQQQF